jgi:hypothetical protein
VQACPALSVLKTIVPVSATSDLYKYDFRNGVHILVQWLRVQHLLLAADGRESAVD